MLIELNDTIVSAEIFKRKFVCDLAACKGACCIEGDAGAPLTTEEVTNIENDLHINETQISGSFIDGDHIEVSVSKNGTRYMSIRYNQNIPTVVSAVYAVVQDHAGPCQDFSPEFFEGIEESFN